MLREIRKITFGRYALPTFAVALGCAPADPSGVADGSYYARSASASVNNSNGGTGGSGTYALAGASTGGVPGDSTVPTQPISFEFAVPGTSQPVQASMPSQYSAGIDVLGYPELLDLPVQYGILPVGFDAGFPADYCASIQKLARLGSTNASARAQIHRMLREQGSVVARIRISTLVGPEFAQRAVSAARAAGDASAAHVSNPIEIDSVTITLELAEDAISNLLGATEAIATQVGDALKTQGGNAYAAGFFSAAIGAKDLWCDLASGKAMFRLEVTGTMDSRSYHGQTQVKGVQSL